MDKAEKIQAPKGDIAVVNGVGIKKEDFTRELFAFEEQYANRGEKPDEKALSDMKKKVLEKMIETELLYQESVKNGFKVEDSTVDEQFNKFKGQFKNADEFNKELARVKLTEASLKNQIRQVMTIQQYINKEFVEKIKISDEEIKKFYETNLKDKIEKNLKQEKIQDEVGKFLDKLKEKSEVKRNL
uniref:Peptidylprolyl isomerase n=1 Tax=uncultured Desulfobacterium sp. TaxID=201089 RepID=E1YAS6_9BACT|nr:hypothetical protein N47_H24920 [uncultured Desulfobacterium sp.]